MHANPVSFTPSLALQVVTLILWAVGRFFLYSSYFAIFGALFGFTNFGKMVAIDNTFNGLVGLLQLPFTYWALHGLGGNFTLINCLQVPPFAFHITASNPYIDSTANGLLGRCKCVSPIKPCVAWVATAHQGATDHP